MRDLRAAAVTIVLCTAVLGLLYPLALAGLTGAPGPDESLVGRSYAGCEGCFQSRPSVTDYSTTATAFNNQGPNQQALADQLSRRVHRYLRREGRYTPGLTAADIPSDAVTTSASGLDPDISAANARIQANRVAAVRGIPRARVLDLISGRSVDVRELNAELGR